MESQTTGDRLSIIIKDLGLNISQFVEFYNSVTGDNRTRQWIQPYLTKRPNDFYMFTDFLERIGYSPRWYLYGEGEMKDVVSHTVLKLLDMRKLESCSLEQLKEIRDAQIKSVEMIDKIIEYKQTQSKADEIYQNLRK